MSFKAIAILIAGMSFFSSFEGIASPCPEFITKGDRVGGVSPRIITTEQAAIAMDQSKTTRNPQVVEDIFFEPQFERALKTGVWKSLADVLEISNGKVIGYKSPQTPVIPLNTQGTNRSPDERFNKIIGPEPVVAFRVKGDGVKGIWAEIVVGSLVSFTELASGTRAYKILEIRRIEQAQNSATETFTLDHDAQFGRDEDILIYWPHPMPLAGDYQRSK